MSLGTSLDEFIDDGYAGVWTTELSEGEAIRMAEDYCAQWMQSGGPVPGHIEAMERLGLMRDYHGVG